MPIRTAVKVISLDTAVTRRESFSRDAKGPRASSANPDYVADLQTNDGQRLKRMDDRARGKPVRRPQPT